MAVAKRKGSEKPVKMKQMKVQVPAWGPQIEQTTLLASPVYIGQAQCSLVQSLSHVRLFATQWIAARQASLSITNSQSSHELMCIDSVMPSSHLILCRPLLLLPPILPRIRVFSNESTLLMRWPKYWIFSLSISPPNEHPGLVSFRMELAIQIHIYSHPLWLKR